MMLTTIIAIIKATIASILPFVAGSIFWEMLSYANAS